VFKTGRQMRFAKADKKGVEVSKHYRFDTKDYVDMNFSGLKFAISKVDRCVARIRNLDTATIDVVTPKEATAAPIPGKTIDLRISQLGRPKLAGMSLFQKPPLASTLE
jgi:hypothetical protein